MNIEKIMSHRWSHDDDDGRYHINPIQYYDTLLKMYVVHGLNYFDYYTFDNKKPYTNPYQMHDNGYMIQNKNGVTFAFTDKFVEDFIDAN